MGTLFTTAMKMLTRGRKLYSKGVSPVSKKLQNYGKTLASPGHATLSDLSALAKSNTLGTPAGYKNILKQTRVSLGKVEGTPENPVKGNRVTKFIKNQAGNKIHDAGKFLENPGKFLKTDIKNLGYDTKVIDGATHITKASKGRKLWKATSSPMGFGAIAAGSQIKKPKKAGKDGVSEYALWRFAPPVAVGRELYNFKKSL